jgi:UDP-N-acetylglucosamine transferase subunit ALG13
VADFGDTEAAICRDGRNRLALAKRLRICLAASGGGHLRQLLDLKPLWEAHDVHFVTEPTSLAQSVAQSHRVHTVPHFRTGQFRTHALTHVTGAVARNAAAAWRAVRSERPQLVISTGAGAVFFAVLFAKLRGARFVHIESFARVENPSKFGRLARRLADLVVVQSPNLAELWPEAEVFDPFVTLGAATGIKEDLGLVTVGTVLPFDRLVNAVASLDPRLRPARIIAQVGKGGVRPEGMEVHESIGFSEMQVLLKRANVVFCHGGTGSLITALRAGCRIVAMPRRAELGEHQDDHQSEIVGALAARGLIEVAEDASELERALDRALAKQPQRATTDYSALIERLRELIGRWFREQGTSHSG